MCGRCQSSRVTSGWWCAIVTAGSAGRPVHASGGRSRVVARRRGRAGYGAAAVLVARGGGDATRPREGLRQLAEHGYGVREDAEEPTGSSWRPPPRAGDQLQRSRDGSPRTPLPAASTAPLVLLFLLRDLRDDVFLGGADPCGRRGPARARGLPAGPTASGCCPDAWCGPARASCQGRGSAGLVTAPVVAVTSPPEVEGAAWWPTDACVQTSPLGVLCVSERPPRVVSATGGGGMMCPRDHRDGPRARDVACPGGRARA